MADVTIELLKTQLRQLRIADDGSGGRDPGARNAAATNVRRLLSSLLRLTEVELSSRVRQRGGDEDQERGIPSRKATSTPTISA